MSRLSTLAILVGAALAGCGNPPPAETKSASSAPAAEAAQADLLAAAEPFEALTETAFSASPEGLVESTASATAAAHDVIGALPKAARAEMNERLAAIEAARAKNDRAAIALESVEAYRLLVSGAPPAAIPTEVNLLDYAGFRYGADLKAQPTRWEDASAAAVFAEEKWRIIGAHVTDKSLFKDMSMAIAGMSAAASTRNAKLGEGSARRELDLVDRLESYFAKTPK